MEGIRDALANLTWPQISSDINDVSGNSKLFTESELSSQPLKWLKYLLLSKVGLQPIDDVAEQIKRFPISDRQQAKDWCIQTLERSINNGTAPMVVIKVVPWSLAAQLKNYRTFRPEDVEPAFEKIEQDYGETTHEVWCCQSSIDPGTLSMGGRVTYPRSVLDKQLEIVWFASPRWLESVTLSDFPFPYLRATQSIGSISFTPQAIYIPISGKHSSIEETTLLEDFKWIVEQINRREKSINLLLNILYEYGAKEVCLPFKVSEGKLTIIDWDTEIESTSDW